MYYSWIRLAIRVRWAPIMNVALNFVTDQGRMKFVRPVYKSVSFCYLLVLRLSCVNPTTAWDQLCYRSLFFIFVIMRVTMTDFRDLAAWDLAASRTKETFIANRPYMHPITATMVAKDLGL